MLRWKRERVPECGAIDAVLSRRMGTMGRFWRSSPAAAYPYIVATGSL